MPFRQCVPQLKQFVEDVLDELDPAQEVDDEYKYHSVFRQRPKNTTFRSINDEKFQWMAGRFLLLNSEQYLVHSQITSVNPTLRHLGIRGHC